VTCDALFSTYLYFLTVYDPVLVEDLQKLAITHYYRRMVHLGSLGEEGGAGRYPPGEDPPNPGLVVAAAMAPNADCDCPASAANPPPGRVEHSGNIQRTIREHSGTIRQHAHQYTGRLMCREVSAWRS
jgi:hypothetical protein